jgi:hypothetical protein
MDLYGQPDAEIEILSSLDLGVTSRVPFTWQRATILLPERATKSEPELRVLRLTKLVRPQIAYGQRGGPWGSVCRLRRPCPGR